MTADCDLTTEGRKHLAAVHPELLPLEVDRAFDRSNAMHDAGYFVADRNGLEFAGVRNEDEPTAALVAWAINNLPALLDEVERLRHNERAQKEWATDLEQTLGAAMIERDEAVERLGKVGRCGDTTKSPLGGLAHYTCELPHGHTGMHHAEIPQPGADPVVADWWNPPTTVDLVLVKGGKPGEEVYGVFPRRPE